MTRLILLLLMAALPQALLAIEKPAYTIVETFDEMEIRQYDAQVLATTRISNGEFKEAGNQAFKRLGGYIFGDNVAEEKISMTAPVTQVQDGDDFKVAFYMPSDYDLEALPQPTDETVKLVTEPAMLVIAYRYKGNWSQEKYEAALTKTQAALDAHDGYAQAGEPIWARYSPPFLPGFMKTNEILIPVVPN